MNQHKAVLEWLKSKGSISSQEAFKELGVTRLSAIVFDLRAKGHDVETVMVEGTDRFGHKTRYARYYLRSE